MNVKKKTATLLLSAALAISAVTAGITAFANASAYSYDSENKVLTIKADTDNYTQENYADAPWSKYNNETESIIVQEGVKSIGDFSFCFESALTSVTLPSTLTNIGAAAFAGSDTLKEITIPNTVSSIGDNAFGYNSQMKLTDGFVATCSPKSYAQNYCLSNYIMFNSPITTGESTAEITTANEQHIWSFAPKTNCTITFSSNSNDDTYALIYDASTYTYSNDFSVMKDSAITENDDKDDDSIDFGITYDLTAGKRYYLSAKYKNPSETGNYKVNFSFVCKEHIYKKEIVSEPSCETDGQSLYTCIGCGHTYYEKVYATGHTYELSGFDGENATVKCKNCDSEFTLKFMDYVNGHNTYLDVVGDGTVNAKDYAKLLHTYKK